MVTTIHRYTPTNAKAYTENGLVVDVNYSMHSYESRKSDPVSGGWITFPDGSKFRKPTAFTHRESGVQGLTPYVQRGDTGAPDHNRRDIEYPLGGRFAGDYLLSSLCPSFPGNTITQLNSTYPVEIPFEMENEAVTKALNDIADQKANIGEDLATFRQTLRLLSNPCTTLLSSLKEAWGDKSIRKFLNRSIRDVKRNPIDFSAQKYLEYVYGWKPLVSDIYGIIELAKQQGQRPFLLHGKGVSKRRLGGGTSNYHDFSEANNVRWTSTQEDAKVSAHIYGRIDPDAQGLRTLNQLGLLNPLSLAWELVSWSFVVDWFCPIGPVFNALTAPVGLKFVSGTISAKGQFRGQFE